MKKTLQVVALAFVPLFAVAAVKPEKVVQVVQWCCGLPCPGHPQCPIR